MKKIFLFIVFFTSLNFAEEIFLSATKEGIPQKFLPSNTIVIIEEEINQTNAKNVGELLDRLTTVEVGHYGTLGSIKNLKIRNSTADQVLILLNGVPLSGSGKGAINLALIPTESVERIEIIQGSCSALYGANAVGGVVNIITKKAKETKPKILSNISYGDFNTYILNAEAHYNTQDLSLNINASNKHSDGWRENSKYDSLSGYASFSLPVLYGKFTLDTLINKSKVGIPGPATIPMLDWDGEKEKKASTPYVKEYDDLYFINLSYDSKILTTKISYNNQKLLYDNSEDPVSWNKTKTDSVLNTLSLLNTISLPYKFFVSLNYEYTQIDQRYPLNPNDNFKKDVSNIGVAIQKDIIYSKFSVVPTIRWDSNSLFGNKFSPQVMFVYNLADTKFSFSAGTSWRAPTFLDLYWPDQICVKGNPELKPEESYSVDLGFEQNFEEVVKIKLNPFYRYIKDQIRWYPVDPTDPWSAWTPSNVDETIAQGVEVACEFIPVKSFNNKLSVLVSDNRIRKKGEEEKGWQKQAYSPLFNIILTSKLSLPYEVDLLNNLKYTDTQYSSDDEKGIKLNSFVLWNVRIQKNLSKFVSLYLQVNDLLDQKGVNRAGYPQPGRNYEFGLSVNLSI
jgi:outer membrane cobalamin receptor